MDVAAGSFVAGATVNSGGRLARMAKLVEEAQNDKAAVQRLADRISAAFAPVANVRT